jgi:hypothetical protein
VQLARKIQEEVLKRFQAVLPLPRSETQIILDTLLDPNLEDKEAVALLESQDFVTRVGEQEVALKGRKVAGVLSELTSVEPNQVAAALDGKVSSEDIQVRFSCPHCRGED